MSVGPYPPPGAPEQPPGRLYSGPPWPMNTRRDGSMRAPDPAPVNDGSPQRLLVAEDLEDARTPLQQLLHLSLGLDVDVAVDGQQALQMLETRPYSILVTDLRMPKLGGL